MSRGWVVALALGVAAVLGLAAFQVPIGTALFRTAVDARAGLDATQGLPDGLHVALCGTGSPLPDPTRAGPCTVVIAGTHIFVVDIGEGGAKHMTLMKLPIGRVEALFLTHFHSDHIDGLGPLLLLRWTVAANTAPLPVYGPPGVERVVGGFDAAYALDAGYRTAHHGITVAPPSGTGGTGMPFAIPPKGETRRVIVYDQGGVRVSAFRVDHGPVDPAVGYRFDYKGRSVVFSGDMRENAALVAAAKGADLLVHEGLQPKLVGLMHDALARQHQAGLAKVMRDILTYHTSPEAAAKEAEAAGVRQLVFSHIIPPLPSRIMYPAFLGEARRYYRGPITVGEDGMVFSLPPGSREIAFTRWPVE